MRMVRHVNLGTLYLTFFFLSVKYLTGARLSTIVEEDEETPASVCFFFIYSCSLLTV